MEAHESAKRPRRRSAPTARAVIVAVAVGAAILTAVLISSTGGSGRVHHGPSGAPAGASKPVASAGSPASEGSCGQVVASTVGHIGAQVYRNDLDGLNAHYSAGRLQKSAALRDAVARGDATGASRALRALLVRQIARVRVYRAKRLLAEVGRDPALGPVTGPLRDAGGAVIGRYEFSVQGDSGFLGLTRGIAGAEVLIRSGERQVLGTLSPGPARLPDRGQINYGGQAYFVYSEPAQGLSHEPLRISFLIPAAALSGLCGANAAETIATTIGKEAVRIYSGELHGGEVRRASAIISHAPDMLGAVARSDPAAVRTAVVRLFRTHLHFVRVRVTRGARLINDVGGPFVLAPVTGSFRSRKTVIGNYVFAVQDDAGFLKLVHNFTGAEVVMRVRGQEVGATLRPGPASIPDRGAITYRGVRYQAFSFLGTAFPSGPLRISILVRPERYRQ